MAPVEQEILIIFPCPTRFEFNAKNPWTGRKGSALQLAISSANLLRVQAELVYLNDKPVDNRNLFLKNGTLTELGQTCLEGLKEKLKGSSKLILASGAFPALLLTGRKDLANIRGYILPTIIPGQDNLVIPTIDMDQRFISNDDISILCKDFQKASRYKEFNVKTLTRPEKKLRYKFSSAEEVLDILNQLRNADQLSVDIEVSNFEMSSIGFSATEDIGYSIPIQKSVYNSWTSQELADILLSIAKLLETPMKKILQNAMFDISFLLFKYNIHVKGPILDTMILHSIMNVSQPKNLGFLGSVYLDLEEPWKHLRETSKEIK
jgi:hypothetical protein